MELEIIRRRIEQEGEESHGMENVTRIVDMDQNVVDELDGDFENGQNFTHVNFLKAAVETQST